MNRKFKIFFKWTGALSVLLGVFFFGMYSNHNENIREWIFSAKKLKNISYSNYSKGQDASPRTINLIISDSSQTVIEKCRSNAINAGILRDKNKIEVPAKLTFGKDTFNISMRLKGDYSDHWIGDKWSYRIKMKGEDRLFGMKSFSVQAPDTRGFLNEWYFHKFMKREGLIALRYSFVSLQENGKNKGIYAIEESFDKQLVEFNNRREAPILKFDENILIDQLIINEKGTYSQENLYLMAKIDVFKGKRTLKDPYLYDQYQKGKFLLESLRSKRIKLNQAMDVEKAAKLFAIADITGGHHGLRWKNVRFYYNPVVGKLELIGFDSNSGHLNSEIYYNRWVNNRIGEFEVKQWKDVFFEDPLFIERYFFYLKKYSDSMYLTSFHKEIKGERELYESYIYSENSMYKFFINHYELNASMIREKVTEYESSLLPDPKKYFISVKAEQAILEGDTELFLSFKNNSALNCNILGLFDSTERKLNSDSAQKIAARVVNQPANELNSTLHLLAAMDSINATAKRKENQWVHRQIKIGYQFENQIDTFYVKIEHCYDPKIEFKENSLLQDFIQIDPMNKSANIPTGVYELYEDLILPYQYSLNCEPGVQLNLLNNAVIAINGPVYFKGKEESPIYISSTDSSGSFLVYQSEKRSKIEYVIFDGLTEKHSGKWHHTGAVNFYEANVDLKNVAFKNNKSEDALNIVRSSFTLTYSSFENIKSDAFDGDFCLGKVLHTLFNNIGNDALDFSGSQIWLANISIDGIGDKAISAGEMSKIEGENIKISNAELGLVSKDLSYLSLKNINLSAVRLGYAVFMKKAIFGPARIQLNNYKVIGAEKEFLIEKRSQATVDDKTVLPNHDDVVAVLYGNLYGKSSK